MEIIIISLSSTADLSYCGQSSPSLISQGLLRLSSHDDNVDEDCGDDDVKDSYKFVKGNKIHPPSPKAKCVMGLKTKIDTISSFMANEGMHYRLRLIESVH